ECTGCSLHNPRTCVTSGSRVDSRTSSQPCLFIASHDVTADLKHLQQGFFRRNTVQTLRSTFYHISHELESSLSAVPLLTATVSEDFTTRRQLDYHFGFTVDNNLATSAAIITTPRSFLKSLFSAKSFASLMSLHRWK